MRRAPERCVRPRPQLPAERPPLHSRIVLTSHHLGQQQKERSLPLRAPLVDIGWAKPGIELPRIDPTSQRA